MGACPCVDQVFIYECVFMCLVCRHNAQCSHFPDQQGLILTERVIINNTYTMSKVLVVTGQSSCFILFIWVYDDNQMR